MQTYNIVTQLCTYSTCLRWSFCFLICYQSKLLHLRVSSDVAEKQTRMCKKWLLAPGPIWSKKPNRVVGIEEELKMCVGSISTIRELLVKNTKTRIMQRITPCVTCARAVPDTPTYNRTMSVEYSSYIANCQKYYCCWWWWNYDRLQTQQLHG